MKPTIDWESLKEAAKKARKNAYAPYSSFFVGCAILASGRIFSGCNVENASYPVGMCAERAALSAAVVAGCRDIDAIVIVGEEAIVPCGMCRQALCEFGDTAPVLLVGPNSETLTDLGILFPMRFMLE